MPFAGLARYVAVSLAAFVLPLLPLQAAPLQIVDAAGNPLPDAVILVSEVAPSVANPPVMDQLNMQFQPRILVVNTGASVDFPNSDDVRHHVYSFSAAKRFELRLFQGSDAPPVVFDQPGPVILGCNIHDNMLGYILVTELPWHAVSDADGALALADLPVGPLDTHWWHPSLAEQSPVALGDINLREQTVLSLPVTLAPSVAEPPLSPLQQRFRKAAEHATH